LVLKFKGYKMKQTPLTNMENRWILATKEAFDALVAMGYALYACKYLGYKKLEVTSNGIIFQVGAITSTSKQAYYHKGHFYDQPYEEFTITKEKVPFPELEDIEEFTGPKWWIDLITRFYSINGELIYKHTRIAYENGVPVTWKLKEKINRKLHENRALALAIGRWLVNHDCIQVDQGDLYAVCGLDISKKPFKVGYGGYWADECTLPMDERIPGARNKIAR